MELQVLSVTLEDRYPPALLPGMRREDVLADDFFADRGPTLHPHEEGCIAFVFGRAADGQSVCVRVEGVRPRLFFAVSPGDSFAQLKRELENEVRAELRNTHGIQITHRRFAHFYDYDPDETTASGRKVFDYAEASYPNQMSFRAACKLRRKPEDGKPVAPVRPAHEAHVDPLVRAMRELRLTPSMWSRVSDARPVEVRVTTCDVELQGSVGAFTPLPEVKTVAPCVRLYYDIETLGLYPDKPIVQVSMVVASKTGVAKHLVAVRTVAPIAGVTVHACNTEADLLRTTRRLLIEHDPDFVLDYNGSTFDLSFLDARALKNDVAEFHYLSRFALKPVALRELNLSSGGMGDNNPYYYDMPGRDYLDLFLHFKMSEHEMNYKLSTFARKYLNDDKEDMNYKEIPVLQAGSAEDRARLGSYCVHDSYLLYLLDEKRSIVTEHLAYASVFCIPIEWVRLRGQQVRYISQLLEAARTAEAVPLLLNTPKRGLSTGDEGYVGAVVNEPVCGFHKVPVVTLDWMSLYPSLMQAHNLCPSTLVRDPKLFAMDGVVAHPVRDGHTTHFQTKHKGILPRILESLLSERKLAKKEVKRYTKLAKEEGDAEAAMLASVFDKRQLALKVSANSIYGACGAGKTGKYPCLAVSETTTYRGREAMDLKKELLPAKYPGIRIIYGDTDSVMVAFPNVTDDVQEAGRLGEEAAAYITAAFAELGWPQMVLEFEEVKWPFLMPKGKKRYAHVSYEPDAHGTMVKKGIKVKGLETERRDTLPFLKDVMRAVLDAMLEHGDERLAVQRIETMVRDMVDGKVPMDKFVMSKSISAKVVEKTDSIVVARVNAKRKEREKGSEEAVGDRVPFVYLESSDKNAKAVDIAEDPTYARAHGLPLNYLYYLEHCVRVPLTTLFDSIEGVDVKIVFDKAKADLERKRLGVKSIASFFGEGASAAPSKVHVPRPPAPPARKKRK